MVRDATWTLNCLGLSLTSKAYLLALINTFARKLKVQILSGRVCWKGTIPSRGLMEIGRLAVRRGLEDWVSNVKQHLREILGPDSLIPFENMGITLCTERRRT